MDMTSKALAVINILLVVFLGIFWHRCNYVLLDADPWKFRQCQKNNHQHNENMFNVDPIVTDIKTLHGGSSVWCRGRNNTDRSCRFHNLCFSPSSNTFLFLHGAETIISGVPDERYSPALLDLSSVPNHNTQYFHYTDVPVHGLFHFKKVIRYRGVHFMFNRFNPSNLMHVFHDDVMPVFYTLLQQGLLDLETVTSTARLVFLEGWQHGEYFDMYGWLSRERPLLKDALMKHDNDALVCFDDAFLGLSKETTWYQYGFNEPQGPLQTTKVTGSHIKVFTDALLRTLNVSNNAQQLKGQAQGQQEVKGHPQACLFTRDSNRLILNEGDLISTIAQVSGFTTVKISLDDLFNSLYPHMYGTNPNIDDVHSNVDDINPNIDDAVYNRIEYERSLRLLLENVRKCKVVVGMHGSLLTLLMFLLPGSVVVELYPYAVNPGHYTPYKTLANIPGMQLTYKAWRNNMPENTVAHADAAPEQGGIVHLSVKEQQNIVGSHEVPRHLCCSDPEWLYRIYQDTVVDIPSFHAVLQSAITDSQNTHDSNVQIRTFESNAIPGNVQNAKCERTITNDVFGIKISWQPPWNLVFFASNLDKKYEVWIQGIGQEDYGAWMLEMTEYLFTEGLNMNNRYRAWVRCLVGGKIGPFVSIHPC